MAKNCPLCHGAEFEQFRFGLLVCCACGLVLNHSIWEPQANESLNEQTFGEDYRPVRSLWVTWFERANNRRTMARLDRAVSEAPGQLLEVGVGSGSFLAYAKDDGYSVWGCDLSPAIARRVQEDVGVSVHCGTLQAFPHDRFFDVVVMKHVLEHVSDPIALLLGVRQRLKPGGVLYLAVPNLNAWEALLPGWVSYAPYHLTYFTPKTIRMAIQRSGLVIEDCRTHESFSGWFIALMNSVLGRDLVEGRMHVSGTTVNTFKARLEHPYRLAMVGFGAITYPFRRVQAWLQMGDEIVVIARKQERE